MRPDGLIETTYEYPDKYEVHVYNTLPISGAGIFGLVVAAIFVLIICGIFFACCINNICDCLHCKCCFG